MHEAKGNPGNSPLSCSSGPRPLASLPSSLHLSELAYVCFIYNVQSLVVLSGRNRGKCVCYIFPESEYCTLKLFMGLVPASLSGLMVPPWTSKSIHAGLLEMVRFHPSCSCSSSASGDLLTPFLVGLWRLYSIHVDFLCKIYLVTSHTSLRLSVASSVLGSTLNHLYNCTFVLYCNYLSFFLSRPWAAFEGSPSTF